MCKVAEYNRIQDEIARLTLIQDQMKAEFLKEMADNGIDKIMAEDGIHFVSLVRGWEPRWVEPKPEQAQKYLNGYMDNGRKDTIKYH